MFSVCLLLYTVRRGKCHFNNSLEVTWLVSYGSTHFRSSEDWLFLVTCVHPLSLCVCWRSLCPSWLFFFEGVLYLAYRVIPLIRDGPRITSSNKNQEEEQDSRFSGKCVPFWRSWKPRECWTCILLAWCLRVRLLGADKGLELPAKLHNVSGKVGVAEANSWPNCAQNRLGVGWGSLLSPYPFCFVYLFFSLSIPFRLGFLL